MRKPITLLSLFVFLFFSCNTEGHRGVSKSIVESKKRKSFLFSYEIFIPNQVKVDSLDIDEVFVEESWFVGKSDNTRDSEFLSLVIVEGGGNTFFKKYTVGGSKEWTRLWEREEGNTYLLSPVNVTDPAAATAWFQGQAGKAWNYFLGANNCADYSVKGLNAGGAGINFYGPLPSSFPIAPTMTWAAAQPHPIQIGK